VNLSDLISAIEPLSVKGGGRVDITGVACDSRQLRPGQLFVAIPGTDADGWTYVRDALGRGAAAVVSEHAEVVSGSEACFIHVADARAALGRLAARFHGHPSDRLLAIGITGTNGKTTCACMLRDIFLAHGRKPGTLTTVAYQVGQRSIPATRTTPDAAALQEFFAQMVGAGCDTVIMEATSHALDQKRTSGIDFDAAIFTNLTQDHLDYHRTMETYFAAKARLFTDLGRGSKLAVAVINIDDPWGRQLAGMEGIRARRITYGLAPEADVRAADVTLSASGTAFRAVTPWGEERISARLLGRFNVSNMLAAMATAGALGVPLRTCAQVLGRMTSVRGRLEEVQTGREFQLFVDYAHTEDALDNVLTTLREITRRRLIAVFGCGGNRDRGKRPKMGRVVSRKADMAIVTSDNPRREPPGQIIAEVLEGIEPGASVEAIEDRREAIRRALALAGPGDVVLIAGKGHEEFQELANRSVRFDDREVVREELGRP
jgi:UDP-N-acetylmuramoyl-L-alanyl-D-glutamate--2,6-diaminopimelate ligase